MAARKRGTAVRQTEIARAALDLVGSRGMAGLRMAALARRVGIVPSGIYRHYRGKDQVIDAILDYIRARFAENVRAAAQAGRDPLARLHALLSGHARLLRESEALPVVVFSAEVYTGNPRRRARLLAILEFYLGEIAALVRQGQEEGSIRRDLEPAAAAALVIGLVQPPAILRHLSGGRYDVLAGAEAAWPMFCRAVQQLPSPRGGSGRAARLQARKPTRGGKT